jgi:hypothetical protein
MKESIIRREVCPFEVELEEDSIHTGENIIKDIYITELGYVMVSVYNKDRKVTVNYICKELKEILPSKIKIKGEVAHQSSGQQPSIDDIFPTSL